MDVVDPCGIADGWFILDFTTFRIKAALGLPKRTETAVKSTIARFQFNTDNDYVSERINVVRYYTLGLINLPQVQAKYPFIAQQIQVQDFDRNFRDRAEVVFKKIAGRP